MLLIVKPSQPFHMLLIVKQVCELFEQCMSEYRAGVNDILFFVKSFKEPLMFTIISHLVLSTLHFLCPCLKCVCTKGHSFK